MTCPILPRYTMCISIKGTLGNISSSHSILDISNPCSFNCKDAQKAIIELAKLCLIQQFSLDFQ